jgi:hypothetical protein
MASSERPKAQAALDEAKAASAVIIEQRAGRQAALAVAVANARLDSLASDLERFEAAQAVPALQLDILKLAASAAEAARAVQAAEHRLRTIIEAEFRGAIQPFKVTLDKKIREAAAAEREILALLEAADAEGVQVRVSHWPELGPHPDSLYSIRSAA